MKKLEETIPIRALQIALGMVGMPLQLIDCEAIIETQKMMAKMGDQFNLRTAIQIRTDLFKKYKIKKKN